MLVPPPPPPPKAPVVQATTSNRFTVVQLEGLVAKLRASAVGATLSAEGLAALLTRLGAATFDAAAPALPAAWRPLGASAYAQLAALYHAPGAAPQVAWPAHRRPLAAARAHATPRLAPPSTAPPSSPRRRRRPAAAPAAAEEGEEAAAALEEATQEAPAAAAGGGAVLDRASYDALTLWFEGDYAAGEVEGEEGEYSVVGALKAALFDIFATAEGDAPPKVDLQKLLLYCCGGAASAFGVLGHADGGLLSLAQLHDLFHREGAPDAAVGAPAHDDAFGTPALERLFAELKVDAASGRVAYKMVEGHPLGKQLLDACVAYTPKRVRLRRRAARRPRPIVSGEGRGGVRGGACGDADKAYGKNLRGAARSSASGELVRLRAPPRGLGARRARPPRRRPPLGGRAIAAYKLPTPLCRLGGGLEFGALGGELGDLAYRFRLVAAVEHRAPRAGARALAPIVIDRRVLGGLFTRFGRGPQGSIAASVDLALAGGGPSTISCPPYDGLERRDLGGVRGLQVGVGRGPGRPRRHLAGELPTRSPAARAESRRAARERKCKA